MEADCLEVGCAALALCRMAMQMNMRREAGCLAMGEGFCECCKTMSEAYVSAARL